MIVVSETDPGEEDIAFDDEPDHDKAHQAKHTEDNNIEILFYKLHEASD
jgi:hypothetical protein